MYEDKIYVDEPLELPVTAAPSPDAVEVSLTSRFHEDFYPVTNPQGFCLIINISKYRENIEIRARLTDRKGSELDVKRAKEVFEKLQFTVRIKEDLTAEEIDDCLNLMKMEKKLKNHGSFVCFLMAHGNQDVIYGSDGVPCNISAITDKFKSYVCRGLAGKPKIFFIQACRDREVVAGVEAAEDEAADVDSAAPVRCPSLSPAPADFLICYATPKSQAAYRNENSGSIFVQTLCDIIEKDHDKDDLSSMMTRVNLCMTQNPLQAGAQVHHRVAEKTDRLTRKVSLDPRACRFQTKSASID